MFGVENEGEMFQGHDRARIVSAQEEHCTILGIIHCSARDPSDESDTGCTVLIEGKYLTT